MSEWNTNIINEFRANDGKVGGMFEGAPLTIITTTGAKTGTKREAPLMYREEGDRRFVFASKGGADSHPDWFHNIKADPSVTVEVGGETYEATATILDELERGEIYGRQSTDWQQFAEYQQKTDRVIPVVELVRQ